MDGESKFKMNVLGANLGVIINQHIVSFTSTYQTNNLFYAI